MAKFIIDVGPTVSTITPPPQKPLDALRPVEFRKFVSHERGHIVEEISQSHFGNARHRDYLDIRTGLAMAVVEELRDAGHEVKEVEHRKYGPRLEGDEAVLNDAQLDDEVILQEVRRHPMGLIDVDGLDGAAETIALILEYYPEARALVAVGTRNLADELFGKLRRGNLPVSRQFGSRRLESTRCAIVSFNQLNGVQRGKWDLLFIADPQGATHKKSQHAIDHAVCQSAAGWEDGLEHHDLGVRIYGLVDTKWSGDDRQRRILEAFCGPCIVTTLPKKVPVRCHWLSTPSCGPVAKENRLQLKRSAHWGNDRRNDFVAAVARALRKFDQSKLWKYGLDTNAWDVRGGTELNIVVLVETPEHARAIKQRLQDWAVHQWDGKPKSDKEQQQLKGGIVTVPAANRRGLAADVVVVASGEPAAMEIPGFPQTRNGIDGKHVLVIDFKDEFDPTAERMSKARRFDASKRGWMELTSKK